MIELLRQYSYRGVGVIADNANAVSLHRFRCPPAASARLHASLLRTTTTSNPRSLNKKGEIKLNDSSALNTNTTNFRAARRSIHVSTCQLKSVNDIHVTMENSGSNSATTELSSNSNRKTNTSCSQGVSSTDDEEEMEQEEMFVIADPVLGLGNNREWGGPRRGGSMPEPTRFGDWERKGRCTDF
jgi:hypothetical protein